MVDLNPLHYINKFNHMFGDSVASGLEFLGISDPAVDPDGVREIAKTWRHLAQGLDEASSAADRALTDVEWEGEAAKAFHLRCRSARKQATEMAHALREGAKALDDFADQAHELLSEIGVILAEIVEFEIAGLALSVLTAGASEVASTLVAGERALKVLSLIGRIEEEGTALGSVVREVMSVVRGVERALKALKEIRGVATAGRMAKEGMEFTAFQTLLEDPATFKDPGRLAEALTEGALLGIGFGALGKALGKGLKALGPAALARLSKAMGLDCAGFERLKLNPGFDKLPASIRDMAKKLVRDPIDVATGDMALSRTDVVLPGVLPLVLRRTHVSSYRYGGWFGPSWASTLDQRIQADDEGFVHATADGARLCFARPDAGSPVPVRPDTPGSRLTLGWDPDIDGAVRVHDPDTGLTHIFHSPVPAAHDTAVDLPLHVIQDRSGNRVVVEYQEGDIPAAVVHSGGYRIALDHDRSRSRVTGLRLIDPDHPHQPGATLLTLGYDEHGRLVEETDSSGLPMKYTYDDAGRVTSWTDRNDTAYWYRYDERGRVTSTGGTRDALASVLSYDTAPRTTRVTDSLGHTHVYEHNECLRLVRETDPLGNVTRQEWDDRQRLTAVTDPLGHTTRYAYDDQDRLVTVTGPDGQETVTQYGTSGDPVTVTVPGGAIWHMEHDAWGNRTAVRDACGAITRFTYTRNGAPATITDVLGHATRLRCDSAGLPLEVADASGAVTRYERNGFGRVVAVIDPTGATTRLDWTVEGRPLRRIASDGSVETWSYDGEGNCVRHTDPAGGVTSFEYTHFDLVAARVGPDGVRYEFAHDSELRLTQVVDPASRRTWSYRYDPAGRLVSESDFGNAVRSYTHDAAGRLLSRTNPLGQTVRYERDALGRMIRKDVEGRSTTFAYAPSGRLVGAVGPDAVLSLELDERGRRLSETVNGRTLAHAYDTMGRRTRRTTPGGATSTWAYDASGRPIGLNVSGHTVDFERDEVGRASTLRFDETLALAHTFDVFGRLTAQSVVTDAGVLQHREFAYRPDGALTRVEDSRTGTRSIDLDSAGRVTGVRAENWTEAYAYDEVGNQTFADWPATHSRHEATGPRAYAGTRIVRAGAVRYEHDEVGRVVLRQRTRLSRGPETWRYVWDPEDRLTSVTTPDGTRWRYHYDPLGRRADKQRLDGDGNVLEETSFTWDGHTLCEQVTTTRDRPGRVVVTWDHTGHRPLAQTERIIDAEDPQRIVDERFFAIVTDVVGTPTELVDASGDLAWQTRSTVWGTTAWNSDATAYTPLRFPGQYHDPETGLHYNYFRHYDPETARYVSVDPLGLAPAPNPVTYVHNPHTWIDPFGLAPGCGEPVGRTFEETKAKALREAGIPEGTLPLEVDNYVSATTPDWQGAKQLMGKDHQPIYYTEEVYEHPNGEDLIVFQDHWFGHQKPGEPGYQPAHVHVRPFEDTRNGQVPGCEEHYYYDL